MALSDTSDRPQGDRHRAGSIANAAVSALEGLCCDSHALAQFIDRDSVPPYPRRASSQKRTAVRDFTRSKSGLGPNSVIQRYPPDVWIAPTSGPPRVIPFWSQLDVVVQMKLVRMRAQADGVDLLVALVGEPGLDHVLGEDVAAQQEGVVGFQRIECLVERAGRRFHLLRLRRRQVVEV